MFAKYIGAAMSIVLIAVCIYIMVIDLKGMIRKIDGFDRPSLNRDINYTILGLCLLSCLIGGVFTMIILGV